MVNKALITMLALLPFGSMELQAAKLKPLREIKPIGTLLPFYFDPGKVSGIYKDHMFLPDRKWPGWKIGPIVWQVSGVTDSPIPIGDDPATFLNNYDLSSKFAVLDGLGGDIYLRATSVVAITQPSSGFDKRVRALIWPGPPGGGAGVKRPWQILDTPEAAKQLIDDIRQKQDSPDI